MLQVSNSRDLCYMIFLPEKLHTFCIGQMRLEAG